MTTATNLYKHLVSALLVLIALTTPSFATSTCTQSVRECLITEAQTTRASCFAVAAKTSACADSPLGGIAALRASISTLGAGQMVLPVTELGEATTSNTDCLRNFDNLLASTLIYGEPSEDELRRLAKTLRFCVAGPLNTSR
jgi:hypothetical protein